MKRSGIYKRMRSAVAVLIIVISTTLPAPVAPPIHAAPEDDPSQVIAGCCGSEWSAGYGMVYWAYNCSFGGEFPGPPGYLKRKPLYAGPPLTLEMEGNTPTTCQDSFRNLTSTAFGLYYYNGGKGRLEFRPSGAPATPIPVVSTTDAPVLGSRLAVTDEFIFWVSSTNVMRVRKDGSDLRVIVAGQSHPTGLIVVNDTIYWLDDNGLWSKSASCALCLKKNLVATQGHSLLYANNLNSTGPLPVSYNAIYWVETIGTPKIRVYSCNTLTGNCQTGTVYTTSTDQAWKINDLARSGNLLFWPESWLGPGNTSGERLRRLDLNTAGATVVNIAENLAMGNHVFVDNLYVYFTNTNGLVRLPLNAAALFHDLVADAFEITQGIQNLDNDTPLVAKKPTYVRAYVRQLSGPASTHVAARLYGTRNGAPLPGSPLSPLNGTRYVGPGSSYNRARLNDGWLFQLPKEWTSSGATNLELVNLRLVVDPDNNYDDPDRTNNALSRNVNFTTMGPVCALFVRVRTHAPAPSHHNASFWPMIRYAQRLWPVRKYLVYFIDAQISELEGFSSGPFELPDDNWKVMLGLGTVDVLTDDPDACDGGSTHHVGMVHQATQTGRLTGNGAMAFANYSWVKLSDDSDVDATNPFAPEAGETLAHEMAHNKGRHHVLCPFGKNAPDDIDLLYPYPTGDIGRAGPTYYYGFDTKTLTPIVPDAAKDFMSYCSPRWTSDYTWKALFNRLQPSRISAAGVNLAAATNVILITGAVTPTQNTGFLGYGWNFPTATLSAKTLQKWQKIASGAVNAAALTEDETPNAKYHVRLLDAANNILADQPVTPVATDSEALSSSFYFMTTFPTPAGIVTRLELLQDDTVIASRTPGATMPSVSISKPAGGEVIENQMEVTWQASDADPADMLLYTVQYSPDNGVHWFVLLSDIGGSRDSNTSSVLLDNLTIPGSQPNSARIRVVASDGYHTGFALSQPFTVKDRKPEVHITLPEPGHTAVAGQTALLSGDAIDAEAGVIEDEALTWSVDEETVGTGEDVNVPGLAPGNHAVVLTARDLVSQTAVATATLTVAPLAVPQSDTPNIDGFCDDASYGAGTQVQLKPYNNGSRATVHLVHDANALWACFTGLKQGATGNPSDASAFAGLHVDVNHSRDALAQSDDYGFFVNENGGLFTHAGDSAGGFANPGPEGLQAQISALANGQWSAELRIDVAPLGGWNHLVGLTVGHYSVAAQGDDYQWPYASGWNQPTLWATTALGSQPHITGLNPKAATQGDPNFMLVISGTNFISSTQMLWNGSPLPTVFGNGNMVSATVGTLQLATAGMVNVMVRNPSNIDSAPVLFTVRNPQPTISTLLPNTAEVGGADFVLTINGSNFVNGAQVLWNGEALTTVVDNPGQLTVQVTAAKLKQSQTATVTVLNPGPAAEVSSEALFVVQPKLTTTSKLYLPLVMR